MPSYSSIEKGEKSILILAMFIATIIPIQRGVPFDTLSYYSNELLTTGTIVEIPFGKQTLFGLVTEATPLIEAKMTLKHAHFSLKKIKRIVGHSSIATAVVQGLVDAKKQTLVPIGALAAEVLNELFLDILLTPKDVSKEVQKNDSAPQLLPKIVYGTTAERTDHYKRIVRSIFADKKSLVFVAPSIRAATFWYEQLKKGIGDHVVLLHSKRTKRDLRSALSSIKTSERPLLVCTTPHFAHVPIETLGAIILEEESSALYKTNDRYEIDARVVLQTVAHHRGIPIIPGDTLPRFETLVQTGTPTLPRSYVPEKLVIAPTEPYRSILPVEAIELIRYCEKQRKTLFIFTNRKGLAPLSRCADCGTVVECPTCSLPITLRYKISQGERTRLFTCTHCGDTLPSTHTCAHCGGWNITPVSIGTDSIREALESIVPPEHVIVVDESTTPDSKDIEVLIETLQKKRWFVLVGTQKLLPFIKSIDYTLIPFFDRILSVPSPYTVEESLRLIMECNERSKESLVLCSQHPDFVVTNQLATKKVQELISEDIENRRALHYPPFGTLLKLSLTVTPSQQALIEEKVELFFKDYECSKTSARRISPQSMKLVCTWIIGVPLSYTEDMHEELLQFLDSLRAPYKIDTYPTRL